MENQIVVKTEVQPNGDILLFYVDEHEGLDASVLQTTDVNNIEVLPEKYIVEEDIGEDDSTEEVDISQASEEIVNEVWEDEEMRRLLIFYLDNRETFLDGTTKKVHLWAVACKTMLTGKQPLSCEVKLRTLKRKYAQLRVDNQNGTFVNWPMYDLCHQAFHDDTFVQMCLNEPSQESVTLSMPTQNVVSKDGILVVKKVNSCQNKDEKVETMLNLYIKHKNFFQKHSNSQKGLWEAIAMDLGEADVDYWHKRFLNFKQHYIRMVYKRKESGPDSVNWPYMKYFDKIFGEDEEFQRRFIENNENAIQIVHDENSWYETEKTFLVKYYFDCLHEFLDSSVPNKFLWQEVGRLLDKKPEVCRKKFEELKKAHFDQLMEGSYNLVERAPLAILFDNIIAKEVESEVENPTKRDTDIWKTEQIDELVQYLYENIDMLKDSVCYYVCWAALARKLHRSVDSCKKQWNDLTSLYKTILDDKKEDPDMQIDWRYIDLFDRIFDYGMDTNLLDGYERLKGLSQVNKSSKIGVKKITIRDSDEKLIDGTDDEESYDERGFAKRSKKRSGDTKAFKILEYYLKNKDKFASSQQKKLALWEILARQIGISASECAHRFRNFKQVYTGYVQREINKPEMPILWPYYNICKKVFGYRAIKSKLKNGKMDSDDPEDWAAKEIKQLINYFARNYHELSDNVEQKGKWTRIAHDLGRTENSCCEKFLELRKSYRKLKTMKTRNPDVKVSWKYFNMIDDIYKANELNEHTEVLETMEVDENSDYEVIVKSETQEDDDFQCIIVIPEGEDINNAQIIIQGQEETPTQEQQEQETVQKQTTITKWNRRSKKQLLIQYLKYLKTHKNKEINIRQMWTEIASKLEEKTPLSCKKIYLKLKNQHKLNKDHKTPYSNLIEKILKFKPKFIKTVKSDSNLEDIYEDVPMSDDKVEKALKYYLQNLEDFLSPKFEQKYLWAELAKFICEPVNKIYSKINYLKQTFSDNAESPYKVILSEILTKESMLKDSIEKDVPVLEDESEENWSNVEIERLLTWYLAHLDKFKNPKFVRSYLWMEASDILKKSALVCSKKMLEIRSQYRTMVKENPEELNNWKFYNLCQRIYGTGKKNSVA